MSAKQQRQEKKGTIYDVARESGVSIGTVSRVINHRPNVADATRARVQEVAKQLGFMPQQTTRRTSIGLVVQNIEKIHELAYYGDIICALVNHAARSGAVLEIVPYRELDRVYTHYVQGLIAVLFGTSADRLREITHIPICLINHVPENSPFHTVATDHAEGARMGTEYLLQRGHERVALMQIFRGDWGSRGREKGYREAYDAAGIPVPEELVTYLEDLSVEDVLEPLLNRGPTALLVSGEDLSYAIQEALIHHMKVKIPEDLSLVTYEIPLYSQMLSPPQTTIAQPWDEMARAAMDVVLSAIETGEEIPQHTVFPNRLIERESVGPAA